MEKILKILFLLIVALALFLFFENNSKAQEIEKLKKEFENYKQNAKIELLNLQNQIDKLKERNEHLERIILQKDGTIEGKNKEIKQLKEELEKEQQELKNLEENLKTKEQEFGKIKQEYLDLLLELNESVKWFKNNSAIEQKYSWKSDILIERVTKDCVFKDKLNLACISHLMENTAISIKYKNDSELGKVDFLQSVKQTIDREGGDCEDYSLFFKALLNTLKQSKINATIELFKYDPKVDSIFVIYPLKREASESYWYMPHSYSYPTLKLNESYFYVVCYLENETQGHCVVAIDKNKINNSEQLILLDGAELFEPQNGQFVGKLEKLKNKLLYCYQEQKQKSCYDVILIISDWDIYYKKNEQYVGLKDYEKKILTVLSS
ncbi:MAG: hypothetical protein N3D10_01200 [Candidatus Micrarchaeota archaeon]|nr:hypothetical protein [Candidatus Micrarchaeota archaeon]